MQFLNGHSEYVFLETFGEAGYDLVAPYDVTIIMAEEGDFPQADEYTTEAGAFVSMVNTKTFRIAEEGCDQLALVIYPHNVEKSLVGTPESILERVRLSTLVHELEHVKQANSGRMVTVGFGHYLWEGVEHVITDLKGYADHPWEVEAYHAQFMYLFNGNEAMANAAYVAVKTACDAAYN